MTITQTVEIPAQGRRTIEVPQEVPAGKTIIAFTPAPVEQVENASGKPLKERVFGCAKGQFHIADDFDAPLDDFRE